MKFTELINSNFSRKAEIVIVTIAALVYIGTFQSDQGKVVDPDIIRLAIYGVAWIGTIGIFVQAAVDWKNAGRIINGVRPEIPEAIKKTMTFIAAEPITAGELVYLTGDGRVGLIGKKLVGTARETAPIEGSKIEVG